MGLILVTPPTEEPVDRDFLKDHLRIHREVKDFDVHIDRLNLAARGHVEESILRKQLRPATWKLVLDSPPVRPCGRDSRPNDLYIPRPPLIEIVQVRYRDPNEVWQVMDDDDYQVETATQPGRIRPIVAWPAVSTAPGSFEVEFRAGHEDPGQIPQIVLVGIAEIVRQMFAGGDLERAASSVRNLLNGFRCLDDRVSV